MKNLLYHPSTLLAIALISGVFILSLRKSAQKTRYSSQNINILEQEIEKLAIQVSEQQNLLKSSQKPLAEEKIMRNELLMQKPGEYILQVPEIKIDSKESVQEKILSPWEEWQKLIY